MPRRLPPLNSLRAFEAAARLGGFSRAADELHVTPAAVSQQVRELESRLGVTLFQRQPRGVRLTAQGEQYFAQVAEALQRVETATARLLRPRIEGPLRLSLPQSTAQFWLAPRLQRLLAESPGLQLQVIGDTRLADLRGGEADLALRFGGGDYPGLSSRLIMGDAASVLGLPDAARLRPPALAGAAAPHALLEDLGAGEAEPWLHWSPWLRELRRAELNDAPRIGFSDSGLGLAACRAGAGWCVARLSISLELLVEGSLQAMAPWRATEFAHYLVCRPEQEDDPRIRGFTAWLGDEAQRFAESAQATLGVQVALPG